MRSLRVRLGFITLLAIFLSVSLVQAQDDILRILSNADIRTSDPHKAYEVDTWPTAALFYIGLVRWNDDNTEVVPALAESYEISDDGLTYTFVLREGITFATGRPITPEDIKWSFERLLDPETAAPTAFMFAGFEGEEAFMSGEADELSGITVVDDRTVEFKLQYPVWSLIQRFALPPAFIVDSEGVEAASGNIDHAPAGAGPYVMERWEPGVIITGTANPNYYRASEGLPTFSGFEMALSVEPSVGILRIEAGEADIALDFVPNADYPRLAADPVLAERLIQTAGFPNIDYIIFNETIEPFSNIDVRRALATAVDRDRLNQLLNGRAVPASGPIPPSVLGDNKDIQPLPFDLDAARELLASAGYPDGFEAELLTNTDPINQTLAQAIISDWAQIGVNVTPTFIDNAQFLDTLINQPDTLQIVLTNWFLDYPDPSNIWEPLLACGGSYNWGQYCNEDLEAAFAEANNIPPGDDRWAAFSDFEAQIVDAMPNVFLHHRLDYYFVSDRISIATDPGIVIRWDTATAE